MAMALEQRRKYFVRDIFCVEKIPHPPVFIEKIWLEFFAKNFGLRRSKGSIIALYIWGGIVMPNARRDIVSFLTGMLHVCLTMAAVSLAATMLPQSARAQQIVQCHSGGTGTIPECQQRDQEAQANRVVQCHSGGTGTIPECQQLDQQAQVNRVVQCRSGGRGTIADCRQRDAQAGTTQQVQCHSGGMGTIPECQQRDRQTQATRQVRCHSGGMGTIPECQQRDQQAQATRTVQCHSGGIGTIPECQQRDAQLRGSGNVAQNQGTTSGSLRPVETSMWFKQLPPEYQRQVLTLSDAKIAEMQRDGTWLQFQRSVNDAYAANQNAEVVKTFSDEYGRGVDTAAKVGFAIVSLTPGGRVGEGFIFLGRIVTGSSVARTAEEAAALQRVLASPTAGREIIGSLNDPRLAGEVGWVKMAQHIGGVEIHYLINVGRRLIDDVKFVR
jgi:hypothetical protein